MTEKHKEVTAELDAMAQDLQSHIRISRSNEKRLATLNAISGLLGRSLNLDSVLRGALNMIMEVMEVECALIYSLNEESQDLQLTAYDGVSEKFAKGEEIKIEKQKSKLALGVDLGMRVSAACSDGRVVIDRKFNGDKRKLRHLKDSLKSKGTKSARKHLRKLRHKEANKNKNQTHLIANENSKNRSRHNCFGKYSPASKQRNINFKTKEQ
jgi:hypothetical protein